MFRLILLLPLLLVAQASTLERSEHESNPDFANEMPDEPNADLFSNWNDDAVNSDFADAWNDDSLHPDFVDARNDGGSNLDFEDKFDVRGLNLSSLDYERIIGGQDAPKDAFPYMGSIQIGGQHICGCSIIHPMICLTAAHCLIGLENININQITIVVGSITLNPSGIRHAVQRYYGHEKFDKTSLIHDIAVMVVRQAFRWSSGVQPVQLYNSDIPVGQIVWLCGWGYIFYPNPTTSPNTLQYIGFKKISMAECQRINKGTATGNVLNDRTQMCVFNAVGHAGCKGDSGGPLVIKVSNQLLQVGVVSWGIPCARGLPDVYTKVVAYIDWIKAVIKALFGKKLRNPISKNLLHNTI